MLKAIDPKQPQKTWRPHQTWKKIINRRKQAGGRKRKASSDNHPNKNKGRAERRVSRFAEIKPQVPFFPAKPGQRVPAGLAVRSKQGVDQNGWLMNWTENPGSCDQLLRAQGERFPGCFVEAADAGRAIRCSSAAAPPRRARLVHRGAPGRRGPAARGTQRGVCIPFTRPDGTGWMKNQHLCCHRRCASRGFVLFYFFCHAMFSQGAKIPDIQKYFRVDLSSQRNNGRGKKRPRAQHSSTGGLSSSGRAHAHRRTMRKNSTKRGTKLNPTLKNLLWKWASCSGDARKETLPLSR